MTIRLLVVAAVGLVVLAGWLAYQRARRHDQRRALPTDLVPPDLRAGADRTWVVFTTPYCATCGPVAETLREADPTARVVRVDATARPDLAARFEVRRAPTVVEADARGVVQTRLVGAEAVRRHVAAALPV